MKTVAAIVALPLAGLTFWLGYRQRERERTVSYYHKVVVDKVIDELFKFFNQQTLELDRAAREALAGMAESPPAIPEKSKQALADFSTTLFKLNDLITDRTVMFDERATEQIRAEFEKIQDDATEWFDHVGSHKRRNAEELKILLRRGQRAVIKQLYKGQFRNF